MLRRRQFQITYDALFFSPPPPSLVGIVRYRANFYERRKNYGLTPLHTNERQITIHNAGGKLYGIEIAIIKFLLQLKFTLLRIL